MNIGPLIILSGPSGCGKSTVIEQLLRRGGFPLRLSVSATTRRPRNDERDGIHYYFWDREHFQEEVRKDSFLEWAEVYGNFYGTLRREVEPYREQHMGVILDIDVQGAAQVHRQCPDAVSIFLRTSSWESYEKRLRQRGTEDEIAIQRRLTAARRELSHIQEYNYEVINDDLDTAVGRLHQIVQGIFEGDSHA